MMDELFHLPVSVFRSDQMQNHHRFILIFSAEDLILNPKEHPTAKLGDIVEIYQHPEEENGCRLLLQITCFKEDLKGRGKLSH